MGKKIAVIGGGSVYAAGIVRTLVDRRRVRRRVRRWMTSGGASGRSWRWRNLACTGADVTMSHVSLEVLDGADCGSPASAPAGVSTQLDVYPRIRHLR
jgi:hypothetical protein